MPRKRFLAGVLAASVFLTGAAPSFAQSSSMLRPVQRGDSPAGSAGVAAALQAGAEEKLSFSQQHQKFIHHAQTMAFGTHAVTSEGGKKAVGQKPNHYFVDAVWTAWSAVYLIVREYKAHPDLMDTLAALLTQDQEELKKYYLAHFNANQAGSASELKEEAVKRLAASDEAAKIQWRNLFGSPMDIEALRKKLPAGFSSGIRHKDVVYLFEKPEVFLQSVALEKLPAPGQLEENLYVVMEPAGAHMATPATVALAGEKKSPRDHYKAGEISVRNKASQAAAKAELGGSKEHKITPDPAQKTPFETQLDNDLLYSGPAGPLKGVDGFFLFRLRWWRYPARERIFKEQQDELEKFLADRFGVTPTMARNLLEGPEGQLLGKGHAFGSQDDVKILVRDILARLRPESDALKKAPGTAEHKLSARRAAAARVLPEILALVVKDLPGKEDELNAAIAFLAESILMRGQENQGDLVRELWKEFQKPDPKRKKSTLPAPRTVAPPVPPAAPPTPAVDQDSLSQALLAGVLPGDHRIPRLRWRSMIDRAASREAAVRIIAKHAGQPERKISDALARAEDLPAHFVFVTRQDAVAAANYIATFYAKVPKKDRPAPGIAFDLQEFLPIVPSLLTAAVRHLQDGGKPEEMVHLLWKEAPELLVQGRAQKLRKGGHLYSRNAETYRIVDHESTQEGVVFIAQEIAGGKPTGKTIRRTAAELFAEEWRYNAPPSNEPAQRDLSTDDTARGSADTVAAGAEEGWRQTAKFSLHPLRGSSPENTHDGVIYGFNAENDHLWITAVEADRGRVKLSFETRDADENRIPGENVVVMRGALVARVFKKALDEKRLEEGFFFEIRRRSARNFQLMSGDPRTESVLSSDWMKAELAETKSRIARNRTERGEGRHGLLDNFEKGDWFLVFNTRGEDRSAWRPVALGIVDEITDEVVLSFRSSPVPERRVRIDRGSRHENRLIQQSPEKRRPVTSHTRFVPYAALLGPRGERLIISEVEQPIRRRALAGGRWFSREELAERNWRWELTPESERHRAFMELRDDGRAFLNWMLRDGQPPGWEILEEDASLPPEAALARLEREEQSALLPAPDAPKTLRLGRDDLSGPEALRSLSAEVRVRQEALRSENTRILDSYPPVPWGGGPRIILASSPVEPTADQSAVIYGHNASGNILWIKALPAKIEDARRVRLNFETSGPSAAGSTVVWTANTLRRMLLAGVAEGRLNPEDLEGIWLTRAEKKLNFKNPKTLRVLESRWVKRSLASGKRRQAGKLLRLSPWESFIIFDTAGDDPAAWKPIVEGVVESPRPPYVELRFTARREPGLAVGIDRESIYRVRASGGDETQSAGAEEALLTAKLIDLAARQKLPFNPENTPVFLWVGSHLGPGTVEMFNAAFERQNASSRFGGVQPVALPFEIPEREFDELFPQLLSHPLVRGIDVTAPYKTRVAEKAAEWGIRLEPASAQLGVASFLAKTEKDGVTVWTGDIMDGEAWFQVSESELPDWQTFHDKRMVLFGAGGAGQAVLQALSTNGRRPASITVVEPDPRHRAKAQQILRSYGPVTEIHVYATDAEAEAQIRASNVQINATQLGKSDGLSPLSDPAWIQPGSFAFDLNWWRNGPPDRFGRPTPFLYNAREQGARVANGMKMSVWLNALFVVRWLGLGKDWHAHQQIYQDMYRQMEAAGFREPQNAGAEEEFQRAIAARKSRGRIEEFLWDELRRRNDPVGSVILLRASEAWKPLTIGQKMEIFRWLVSFAGSLREQDIETRERLYLFFKDETSFEKGATPIPSVLSWAVRGMQELAATQEQADEIRRIAGLLNEESIGWNEPEGVVRNFSSDLERSLVKLQAAFPRREKVSHAQVPLARAATFRPGERGITAYASGDPLLRNRGAVLSGFNERGDRVWIWAAEIVPAEGKQQVILQIQSLDPESKPLLGDLVVLDHAAMGELEPGVPIEEQGPVRTILAARRKALLERNVQAWNGALPLEKPVFLFAHRGEGQWDLLAELSLRYGSGKDRVRFVFMARDGVEISDDRSWRRAAGAEERVPVTAQTRMHRGGLLYSRLKMDRARFYVLGMAPSRDKVLALRFHREGLDLGQTWSLRLDKLEKGKWTYEPTEESRREEQREQLEGQGWSRFSSVGELLRFIRGYGREISWITLGDAARSPADPALEADLREFLGPRRRSTESPAGFYARRLHRTVEVLALPADSFEQRLLGAVHNLSRGALLERLSRLGPAWEVSFGNSESTVSAADQENLQIAMAPVSHAGFYSLFLYADSRALVHSSTGVEPVGAEETAQPLARLAETPKFWQPATANTLVRRPVLIDAADDFRVRQLAYALSIAMAQDLQAELDFRIVVPESRVGELMEEISDAHLPAAAHYLEPRIVSYQGDEFERRTARVRALEQLAGTLGFKSGLSIGQVFFVDSLKPSLALELRQYLQDGFLEFTVQAFEHLQALLEAA